MNLFPKDRLIPSIAQKVIFWIRHQILSVMAGPRCFKNPPLNSKSESITGGILKWGGILIRTPNPKNFRLRRAKKITFLGVLEQKIFRLRRANPMIFWFLRV